jgi:hypothetical protein
MPTSLRAVCSGFSILLPACSARKRHSRTAPEQLSIADSTPKPSSATLPAIRPARTATAPSRIFPSNGQVFETNSTPKALLSLNNDYCHRVILTTSRYRDFWWAMPQTEYCSGVPPTATDTVRHSATLSLYVLAELDNAVRELPN